LRKKDEPSFEAYLQTFPTGKYSADARRMLNELKQAAESAWQKVLASKDPAAMERYLADNPNSPHIAEARLRINEWNALRDWEKVRSQPTAALIEGFRNRYPGSPFDAEALRMLEELRAEETWAKLKDSVQASDFDEFVRRFPNSRNRKAAEDRSRMIQDWTAARTKNTADEIRKFLDRYKGSPFETEGRNMLREFERLEAEAKKKKETVAETKKEPEAPKPGGTRTGKDGIIYVRLPGGSYQMGCVAGDTRCDKRLETPRQVNVNAFFIGRNEVTIEAFKRFAEDTGFPMPAAPPYDKDWSKLRNPMVNVNSMEAEKYCAWANPGGRLPNEAEWEFAARGGNYENIYVNGKQASPQVSFFNSMTPQAVASLQPNAFGLFDMTGNVSELVRPADSPGPMIALRGGMSANGANEMRISYRRMAKADERFSGTGFRCVF
jgi:formylglycine-generating enzyme required for sulfatase activity